MARIRYPLITNLRPNSQSQSSLHFYEAVIGTKVTFDKELRILSLVIVKITDSAGLKAE